MLNADPSVKPYLLRAVYEWCADNGLTPLLAVRVKPLPGGGMPIYADLASDGAVTFNISNDAVRALLMNNDELAFTARFNGVSREIRASVSDVAAIYARETGQGLFFPESPPASAPAPSPGNLAEAPPETAPAPLATTGTPATTSPATPSSGGADILRIPRPPRGGRPHAGHAGHGSGPHAGNPAGHPAGNIAPRSIPKPPRHRTSLRPIPPPATTDPSSPPPKKPTPRKKPNLRVV